MKHCMGEISIMTFSFMQIGIWEERKVFGSRGQILKEEFAGRHVENNNRDAKPTNMKLVKVFVLI